MRTEHHILDLKLVISSIEEIRDRLMTECREDGAGWTPEQVGKWEGAFKAVRGILHDELHPLLDAWERGIAFSRAAEDLLAAEANQESP